MVSATATNLIIISFILIDLDQYDQSWASTVQAVDADMKPDCDRSRMAVQTKNSPKTKLDKDGK